MSDTSNIPGTVDFERRLLEKCEAARDELLGALKAAADALDGFDGISIKGTKLHWSRADRQALQRARRVIGKHDRA